MNKVRLGIIGMGGMGRGHYKNLKTLPEFEITALSDVDLEGLAEFPEKKFQDADSLIASGLAGAVRFVGYVDRATALPDCYRAADVFVFASRTETQGLVLLEAMARGTPVVSTAVMGTIDVLSQAKGAVIVREDEPEFAAAVAGLLTDPRRRAGLGDLARRDAEAWSSRALAGRLAALYETLRAHGREPTRAVSALACGRRGEA